eukprot:scaffold2097_cov403-Prasinococcus_capsulatus_cf.AAC.5
MLATAAHARYRCVIGSRLLWPDLAIACCQDSSLCGSLRAPLQLPVLEYSSLPLRREQIARKFATVLPLRVGRSPRGLVMHHTLLAARPAPLSMQRASQAGITGT